MSHDLEAQVYRVWLMQPGISLDELAALVALPAGSATRAANSSKLIPGCINHTR